MDLRNERTPRKKRPKDLKLQNQSQLASLVSTPDMALEGACDLARHFAGRSAAIYIFEEFKAHRLADSPKRLGKREVDLHAINAPEGGICKAMLATELGLEADLVTVTPIIGDNGYVGYLVCEHAVASTTTDVLTIDFLAKLAHIVARLITLESSLVRVVRKAMAGVETSKY